MPIVVVNKVDKPNCRPDEVNEAVFDLMYNLDATEEQLNFHTIYGSAKQNWMSEDWRKPTDNILPLLDAIIRYIPEPEYLEGTPQMLITSLDYSPYVGRIAVGRVHRGTLREGMDVSLVKRDRSVVKTRIKELHTFTGLGRTRTAEVKSGDICALVGIDGFEIGDTIADAQNPEPMKPIAIDEPTMSMVFTINDSPFFGREGKYVTSRHIHERLIRELDKNLALRVERSPESDIWHVYGRGVLHLSVLIETMRREGYELQVGQPQVIFKEIDGVKCEPVEQLSINLPEECSGKVIELVAARKGEMVSMEAKNDRIQLEFTIPSRGIIGLRNKHPHHVVGRGHHVTPLPGIPTLQGRYRKAHQRLAHRHGERHGLCLRHRQAAGPRAFLHLPARRGVCRPGGGRKLERGRHRGERHQVEETDQRARLRVGRKGAHHPAHRVLAGRSTGIHQGRRIRGSDPHQAPPAQNHLGRERTPPGSKEQLTAAGCL